MLCWRHWRPSKNELASLEKILAKLEAMPKKALCREVYSCRDKKEGVLFCAVGALSPDAALAFTEETATPKISIFEMWRQVSDSTPAAKKFLDGLDEYEMSTLRWVQRVNDDESDDPHTRYERVIERLRAKIQHTKDQK